MAFLERIEAAHAEPFTGSTAQSDRAPDPHFSPLEWSVIRLAQVDRLWTIRPVGPVRRWFNWLVGQGNPALANERLEALRRIAVLSWNFGFTIPGGDVADFLSAGFSVDQYELLVSRVRRAVTSRDRATAMELFA